jgi:hypothetical protein
MNGMLVSGTQKVLDISGNQCSRILELAGARPVIQLRR